MRIQKLITNSTLRLRNFKTNSPQYYQYMKNTVQDMLGYACWYLTKAEVRNSEAFWSFFYRWFSLKWPASMQIYWNKRKLLPKKRFNSHRIFLVHQHGRRSIVLEDQDGGRDVTWSALYLVWFSLCSSLFWELRDKGVDLEKFTILALKPRSQVRILIYRTWAIGSCIS